MDTQICLADGYDEGVSAPFSRRKCVGMTALGIVCGTLLVSSALAQVTISATRNPTTLIPNAIRTIYAQVAGDANRAVDWTVANGQGKLCASLNDASTCTLNAETGKPYVFYQAPSQAGSYTVTATSEADKAQFVAVKVNVYKAPVELTVVPHALTLYQGQYAVLQSMLIGSVNTAVRWELAQNPGGAGHLLGASTDRAIGFSASAAGTYLLTATSLADPSKKFAATLYVTDHPMPATATANETMPVDCTATGKGKTYDVGQPGSKYKQLGNVPWDSLKGGDTVRVWAVGGPYHENFIVGASGTVTEPIRVCGVPDERGNLPLLDGQDAVGAHSQWWGKGEKYNLEQWGVVVVHNWRWSDSDPAVRYVEIEGLHVKSGRKIYSFTSAIDGKSYPYGKGAAGIRVQDGADITLRGNEVEDNSNGIFTNAQTPQSRMVRNLLVEGNHVHDNSDSMGTHNLYLQSIGLVVQFNDFGPTMPQAQGGNLKTRAVLQFIRYNYLGPAARIIDMIEPQGFVDYVIANRFEGYKSADNRDPITINQVAANEEAYHHDYVYGNDIENYGSFSPKSGEHSASGSLVHYSEDGTFEKADSGKGGTLWFYGNRVYLHLDEYGAKVFDQGPYYPISQEWSYVEAFGNAFDWVKEQARTPQFGWQRWLEDRANLGKNWITPGWCGKPPCDGRAGDGTGVSARSVGAKGSVYMNDGVSGHVTGMANTVSSAGVPFDLQTFAITNPELWKKMQQPLPAPVADLPVMFEYNAKTHRLQLERE